MSAQPDLFDILPHAPVSGLQPETRQTSQAAAERIEPTAHTLRAAVLRYITSCGSDGATDDEIQHALSMTGNTERPRRRELEQAGWIYVSAETRRTAAGRKAAVWVAK